MKYLINYLPIFTAGIIFIGYASTHYYYGAFNIPIWDYIRIDEIIMLFFPTIVSVIGLFLSLTYSLAIFAYSADVNKPAFFLRKYYNTIKIYGLITSVVILIVMTIITSIIHYKYDDNLNLYPIVYYIFTVSIYFTTYLSIFKSISFGKFIRAYKPLIGLAFLPFILSHIMYQQASAEYKKKNGVKTKISFQYQGTKYSSPEITYIGETHDYVFVYNKRNDESLIFPKSDISFYSIKK